MKQFIIYLNITVCFGHANMKKWTVLHRAKNMGDNRGKSHFPKSTLQRSFTYNAVAPPGPQTLCYMEGAVYSSTKIFQLYL